MTRSRDLLQILLDAAQQMPSWGPLLSELGSPNHQLPSLHLAIVAEPFLSYIMDGLKTVESRFSATRQPPYGRVAPGDMVFVKRPSGPIVGAFRTQAVWYYRLEPSSWHEIRAEFTDALCAHDPGFWLVRARASYATLMKVNPVWRLDPISIPKRDRRAWVVLRATGRQRVLDL